MKLRKGIGAIVLNNKNQVILFQRADYPENWQAPEGGIDEGETPKEALYRELNEEIGLSKDDFDIIASRDESFNYTFDEEIKKKFNCDGQAKYFFVTRLKNDNFKFKFDNKEDEIEFLNFKVLDNNKDLAKNVPPFKKGIYEEVLEYFKL